MSAISLRRLSIAVLVALLVWAPPAFGHAAFLGAQPEPGTRLEASPSEVTLAYTEPLNERLSRATLVSVDDGEEIKASTEASAKRLTLRPNRELPAGAYRLRWHTVSTEDGHALEGMFSFGVRAAAAGSEHVVQQSPFARDGWVRVLLRGLFYVASLLFVGALLLRTLLSRTGSWLAPDRAAEIDVAAVARRERHLVVDIGWAAAGLAAAVALAEAADAAGGLSVAGARDFLAGSVAGAGRAATVVLLAAAALMAGRRRIAAVLAIAAFGAVAASGHAASANPRALSVINDWVHLLSAAVWPGGIALILIIWAPNLRRHRAAARTALAASVLPAYGRIALPAFVIVSVTGLVSLLTQLGNVSALWETDYGRVLAVKIVLVGIIAAVSYWHALRLRPRLLAGQDVASGRLHRRHWQLLQSEPAVSVGVVAAVAVLVAFPLPPRQLSEAQKAVAATPPCDPCPSPEPAADELAVAENAGANVVAAWLRRRRDTVSGTIRITDIRAKPSGARVTVDGAEQRPCGRGCVAFSGATGDRLRVAVREASSTHIAVLPTDWRADASRRARRILRQSEAVMRKLKSVRQSEIVSSGPGSHAETQYRLQAPDRMALKTGNGVESVLIGRRKWTRWRGAATWQESPPGQGLPFSTRRWFRWTPYARHVRLLGERTVDARNVVELALYDPGTPVWMRLTVDTASHRVLRERSVTKAHFTHQRYHAFNARVSIPIPGAADGG